MVDRWKIYVWLFLIKILKCDEREKYIRHYHFYPILQSRIQLAPYKPIAIRLIHLSQLNVVILSFSHKLNSWVVCKYVSIFVYFFLVVSARVVQRKRINSTEQTSRRESVMGTGSYKCWDIPEYTESRRSRRVSDVILSTASLAWETEQQMTQLASWGWELGVWASEMNVPASEEKNEFVLSLSASSFRALSGLVGDCPYWRGWFFTQSTDSDANPLRKYLSSYLGILQPRKTRHRKLTITLALAPSATFPCAFSGIWLGAIHVHGDFYLWEFLEVWVAGEFL